MRYVPYFNQFILNENEYLENPTSHYLTAVENTNTFAFSILKHGEDQRIVTSTPTKTIFDTFIHPLEGVDLTETSNIVLDIERLSNFIAKESRRGHGRYIFCNKESLLDVIFQVDETFRHNEKFKFVDCPFLKSDEAFIIYLGNTLWDCPFHWINEKYIAYNNDWRNYIRKFNFKEVKE